LSGFEKITGHTPREPRDDGPESQRVPGSRPAPATDGAERSGNDNLPGSKEDRPPDEGDARQGVKVDHSQHQGLQPGEAPERSTAGTGSANVPANNNGFGATARSGRRVRVPVRVQESRDQRDRKWVAWIANALHGPELSLEDEIHKVLANWAYDIQDRASDPISFSATSDPDTMYWHQAMQQPDKHEFIKVAEKEVKSHVDDEHFVLMKQSSLPKGTTVLASVWCMKQKRSILSREVYKWKARLNCHGGQQEHGVNFWETYSPVLNWFSIRLFLMISILKSWDTTRQIDFLLAFPQADVECDILFREIPVGFVLKGDKKLCCLKLPGNIYGTKQAG
jgi:hypothetical protein